MYRRKTLTLSMGLFLLGMLGLSCLSTSIFKQHEHAAAQQYIQTIKYRNIVIDLDNGVKTNAQLTFPAMGKGPFPGVLLIAGSGAQDKNETLGFVYKIGPKPPTPFLQIAQYLSERGFAVLRYDKRGVGANGTILDTNVWGNATINDLIQDSMKALNVLIQQPEVDPKRISIIGHSEGTIIAPRVAIDNSTKVKNIILMGTVALSTRENTHTLDVTLPSEYATQVLDKNHTGLISIQQIAKDAVLKNYFVPPSVLLTNNIKVITNALVKEFGTNDSISIEKQLNPLLIKGYENLTAFNLPKCQNFEPCPVWLRSAFSLIPTLSIIGNVSKSTGILILNGENDSLTPVQQAFLLQQRLTEVNHPDHTLITYPNLGHVFYPSSHWLTGIGPIEPYVLADLYTWLEAHSGLSHSYVDITTPATDAIQVH
ncbi:MAG TPA: alpha/beta fold hydrolase [Candidatus Nitrosopolaris sp.]|nr:alpha/beta fold hydrolase [Candidatus Nitrosopolaris sp.]